HTHTHTHTTQHNTTHSIRITAVWSLSLRSDKNKKTHKAHTRWLLVVLPVPEKLRPVLCSCTSSVTTGLGIYTHTHTHTHSETQTHTLAMLCGATHILLDVDVTHAF